jgi:chorismate mutase
MHCRGVRGATTVEENDEASILAGTRELLKRIVDENGLSPDAVAAVIFTATRDLNAVYQARAAREMGWTTTPLLCLQEMEVANSLPRCIRVLLLWNTDRLATQVRHVYLRGAQSLRPDLTCGRRTLEGLDD